MVSIPISPEALEVLNSVMESPQHKDYKRINSNNTIVELGLQLIKHWKTYTRGEIELLFDRERRIEKLPFKLMLRHTVSWHSLQNFMKH
jgi:hypothetical protein